MTGTSRAPMRVAAQTAGGSAALIGLLVLAGWIGGSVHLIAWDPGLTPMQFNAALGIVLAGTGLVAASRGRFLPARVLGGLAALIGLLTLIQYLFGSSLGIDELLFDHPPSPGVSSEGRMAPNMAAGLLFGGLTVALRHRAMEDWGRNILLGTSALTLILGLAALAGYILDIPSAYGWSFHTRIALPASVSVTLLGIGLLGELRYVYDIEIEEVNVYGTFWNRTLPFLLGATALVVTLIFWQSMVSSQEEQVDRALEAEAEVFTSRLTGLTDGEIQAIERLAERTALPEYVDRIRTADLRMLLTDYPHIATLARLGPEGSVRWAWSSEGPGGSGPAPLPVLPGADRLAELVRGLPQDPGSAHSMPVTHTGEGPRLLRLIVPVRGQGEGLQGWLASDLDLNGLLGEAYRGGYEDAFGLELQGPEGDRILRLGADSQVDEDGRSPRIPWEIQDTTFQLVFRPLPSFLARIRTGTPVAALTAGLLLSVLLGVTIALGQQAERGRRTSERVQTAVRRDRDLLDRVLNKSPIGKVLVDASGEIVYANEQAEKVLGLSREEITDRTYSAPEWKSTDMEGRPLEPEELPVARVLATRQEVLGFQQAIEHPGGEKVYLDVHAAPLTGEDGEVRQVIASVQDITDRVEAERALRESEERYRALLQNAQDVVTLMDASGTILEESPSVERVLGWAPGELEGQNIADYLHPDDTAAIQQELARLLESPGESLQVEARFRHKDGSWRILDATGTNLLGHPAVGALVVNSRDVTGRRRMERRLEESEARFRGLFEHIPIGLFRTTVDGRIDEFNPAALRILGYDSLDEVEGKSVSVLYADPEDRKVWQRRMQESGEVTGLEIRIRRKDGTLGWVSFSARAVRDEEGEIAAFEGSFEDITRRKELQEAAEEYAEDLRQVNQELEQFAYVASHDLQEPLRTITSFTQLLERRYADAFDEQAREFFDFIIEASGRMQRMVNDLLQLSRIGRAEPERAGLDLESPLQEAIANLGTAIEEAGAEVEFGELDRVEADHGRIVQLFQNLLTNAIKYRGEETPRIQVRSEPDPEDEEMVRVAVEDNGRGMAPDHVERIFLPFQRLQAREKDGGSGIGLSICRRIVERHGGRIWAESEPGAGSTFYFTLPKEG